MSKPKMDAIEIEVEKLVNGGHGLARLEGRVILIPGALAGERVRIATMQKRRGVNWARDWTLLDPAPQRQEPRCEHAQHCGGCSLLHVAQDYSARLKAHMVRDSLQRLNHTAQIELEPQGFAWETSRYRGKWHLNQHGSLGFRGNRSADIVKVPHCKVVPPAVGALWEPLQQKAGPLRTEAQIYWALGTEDRLPCIEIRAKRVKKFLVLRDELPQVKGVRLADPFGKLVHCWGEPRVTHLWNGQKVHLGPADFFQSNPLAWPLFFEKVRLFCDQLAIKKVWDAHAGAGFLSTAIPSDVQIFASEPNPDAFGHLKSLLGKKGQPAPQQATAETWIQTPPATGVEGVILDPPRTGLEKALSRWLLDAPLKGLLYFSCDLGTFVRDLALLLEQYQLDGPIAVLDVNPGTARMETACLLVHKSFLKSR